MSDDINQIYLTGNLDNVRCEKQSKGGSSWWNASGKLSTPAGNFFIDLDVKSDKQADWFNSTFQQPQAVLCWPAVFDSYYSKAKGEWKYKISVRNKGLRILNQAPGDPSQLPMPIAYVEGTVKGCTENHVMLASKYSYHSTKLARRVDGEHFVNVVFPQPVAFQEGQTLCLQGIPSPKLGDSWTVSLNVVQAYITS